MSVYVTILLVIVFNKQNGNYKIFTCAAHVFRRKMSCWKITKSFLGFFHRENKLLTLTNNNKHKIKTSNEIPAHKKSYWYPHIHKAEVKRQIILVLWQGINVQINKMRPVIDYRQLNQKSIDITNIVDKLGGSQCFRSKKTLSNSNGWRIEMYPE